VLGVEVLDRNVRVGRLEIDLVAREGRVVALVEVRTRGAGSWQRPLDSIDAKKRARLVAAGERLWRERFREDPRVDRLRFDAATVTFDDDGAASVEYVRAFLIA
jgi:putative endonuclease